MLHQSEILADISFFCGFDSEETHNKYIYCLCSRVFCRNEHKIFDDEEINDIEFKQLFDDNFGKFYMDEEDIAAQLDEKNLVSGSNISSAINTQSDNFKTSKTSIDYLIETECLDYLEFNTWEKFWALHGENLVWCSWIEKYSEYINPEFYKVEQESDTDLLRDCSIPELKDIQNKEFQISNSTDSDQYWQELWKKHFEEIYYKHYALYITKHLLTEDDIKIPSKTSKLKANKIPKKANEKYENIKCITSVGALIQNLKCAKLEKDDNFDAIETLINKNITKDLFIDFDEILSHYSTTNNINKISEKENKTIYEESQEKSKMECNSGINISNNTSNIMGEQVELKEKQTNQQISDIFKGEIDNSQNNLKNVSFEISSRNNDHKLEKGKAAFDLMGFAFSENLTESLITDEVNYRKKKIRLQNKYLKFKLKKNNTKIIQNESSLNVFSNEHHISDNLNYDDMTLANEPITEENDKMVESLQCDSEPYLSDQNSVTIQTNEDLDSVKCENDEIILKQNLKRRNRKRKNKKKISKIVPSNSECSYDLSKYWYKRYSLFSKFDDGILMDAESWYSVTPEKVAQHIAERCRCDLIIDAFCGAGGNSIQFAMVCERVIAIDIDPEKIRIAHHNALIYGVADRIEFIVGDFLQLSEYLSADVVFLSPPWGGPEYLKSECYDMENNLQPVPGSVLISAARKITHNVALFLPRNTDSRQLVLMAGVGSSVEIEQNFLDKKLIAVTAYYGELLSE